MLAREKKKGRWFHEKRVGVVQGGKKKGRAPPPVSPGDCTPSNPLKD